MLILFTLVILLVYIYWYGVRTFDYWKKKKIQYVTPLPFVGNYLKHFLQKSSIAMLATEVYNKYPNEKVVGVFRTTTPELVVRDPEIIKQIIITDFHKFYARGFNPHKTAIEPLVKNLFLADGDLWKLLRQRFTPAFSSGKLKAMFPLITERANKLQLIAEEATKSEFYDVRDLIARYTTDFIGACGFGIKSDSLSDENSQFRKLGKRIFERKTSDAVSSALKYIFPEMCKNFRMLALEIEENMNYLVKAVLDERGHKPSSRNDFIDLLLELKKKGNMVGESIEMKNPDGTSKMVEMELSDELITAQVFVFFAAGFETSSTASSYTLHQLAFHPEYQEKIQKEIDEVLARHGNEITYDAVKEMTYLEMAFYESMRMYPSVGYLMRKCMVPQYTIPNIGLTIDENVNIMIPIQAIHRDPKYFKDPEKFDPERFSGGAHKDYIKKFVFLPFGDGPRACVGERLAQMQSMAGLVAFLQKFTVEPAACTIRNPVPDPTGIVSENFVGGLPLVVKIRKLKT